MMGVSCMSRRHVCGWVVALLGGLGSLLASATAQADTLVYVKSGTVYVGHPDGSQARAITTGGSGWAWPSETDGGIIAVAGGVSRISGSFNPSGSDEIYEFDQKGHQVAGPVATQGTYSTVGDPEYVSHFRVAPDNSNIAWTDISSFSDPVASWRNPNGSGTFSTVSPLSYSSPEWYDSTHLLITHDGQPFSNPDYTIYSLANGSNSGWSGDTAVGSASAFQVTLSRNLKFAVETDDAPDYGGTIHNISIGLETTTSPTTDMTNTGCRINLPASQFATNHGSSQISMSFSSDGNTLAWGQDDGVYEANVSNPSDCAAISRSVHLVVPGGAMPFLGAAALSPASRGGSTPTTSLLGVKVNKTKRSATFKFSGSDAASFKCKLDRGKWASCRSPKAYKHLKKGKHTFEVEAIGSGGKADPTPAKKKFRV